MTITKTEETDVTVLKIEGWLDIETTPQLHEYLKTQAAVKTLVFDFENLEYISSSGVREVVASFRKQKEEQGSFSVINVNPDVYDVFKMTGLDKKIEINAK